MEDRQNYPIRSLRFKTPITILAIVALVLMVITSLGNFLTASSDGHGTVKYSFSLDFRKDYFDNHSLYILYTVSLFLCSLASVAAPLLFALYIFVFYKKNQAAFLIPVILGLLASSFIFSFGMDYSIFLFWQHNYNNDMRFFDFFPLLSLLLLFSKLLSLTLAAIFSNKKTANKIFLIIAVAVNLSLDGLSIIRFIQSLQLDSYYYIREGYYLHVIFPFLRVIGSICLYAALLLFVLPRNKPFAENNGQYIPPANPAITNPAPVNPAFMNPSPMPLPMDPEHALRQLKIDYESGKIPAEEYWARRSQIIDLL